MAYIEMSIHSLCLKRKVNVNVILPIDKENASNKNEKLKTLYLLHGMFSNQSDWVNGTRIQRFATEHKLAVVMPCGENSFYVDNPKSQALYGEFIGKELIELTRHAFPLSDKREDTFIGGLSMGGYGALRNGLKYNDVFGSIIGLSSVIIDDKVSYIPKNEEGYPNDELYESIFGDLSKLSTSDASLTYLVDKLIEDKKTIPNIFLACGYDDFLFENNQAFAKYLKDRNIDFSYNLDSGAHEWDFWDKYIKKAIEWLPL